MRKAFASRLPPRQIDTLQQLVAKHLSDPALVTFANSNDFSVTSTERGLQRWEQAHLVAALDVLITYQRERRARSACHVGSLRFTRTKDYKQDPRTRMVELLKRWLRTNAGCASVAEDELRGICGLCRDLLNHPTLFPARNPRSFVQTVAEVYDHLQMQLKEVLDRDRSCAELAQRVLSLSRNLIADAIAYLLLAPTHLRQTDALPSLEVVALWQSLPDDGHPLPGRADPALQKVMGDVWSSSCGRLVSALISNPWCVRMFNGVRVEEEQGAQSFAEGSALLSIEDSAAAGGSGRVGAADARALMADVARQLERGSLRSSGFAGAFRDDKDQGQAQVRRRYIDVVELLFDLLYLLSEVVVLFHRVGDGLGDYGMIRMSPWLHPILDAVAEKIQRLKGTLEFIGGAVDKAYVLARARGVRIEKPAPTDRMCARARVCLERAAIGRGNHVQSLLQVIEELKTRSAPERLPSVAGSLGNACSSLQAVLASADFRASVGDAFPELPPLAQRASCADFSALCAAPNPARLQLAEVPVVDEAAPKPVRVQLADAPFLDCVAPEPVRLQLADAPFVDEPATAASAFDSEASSVDAVPVTLRGRSGGSADSGESTAVSLSAMSAGSERRPSSAPAPKSSRGHFEDRRAQQATIPTAASTRLGNTVGGGRTGDSAAVSLGAMPAVSEQRPSLVPAPKSFRGPLEDRRAQQPATIQTVASARIRNTVGRADVYIMTPSRIGRGLRRRDQKRLVVSAGQLQICAKGRGSEVEVVIDLATDVEACALQSLSILHVTARRLPLGASFDDGVFEVVDYFFEFDSAREARAFQVEITALSGMYR